MNTASRMESNGAGGKIHCSQATADLLIAAGKGPWLTKREDKIIAKGKGEMTTYWIAINSKAESSLESGSHHSDQTDDSMCLAFDDRTERWLDYNVATLELFLKPLVANRRPTESGGLNTPILADAEAIPINELREFIEFPKTSTIKDDADTPLSSTVSAQLKAFVGSISSMYRQIPFHNCK